MTRMIADREFPYRGVRYRVGEELDVEEGHVALFVKIGHAHVKTETELGYETRMMTAGKTRRMRARS